MQLNTTKTYLTPRLKQLITIGFSLILVACMNQSMNSPSSQSDTEAYINPLVEQRADPWILKDDDGTYYFIATAPEFDRIELRSAKTINGLHHAPAKVIWRKHLSGPMSKHIWAPELHKIDGQWYIYFAASSVEDIWRIGMYVLSNTASDPMTGEWHEEGQINSGWQNFALDATTFEHKGKRYLLWAQANPEWTYGSAIWMAEMTSPTTIDTTRVIALTEPEYDWETVTYKVNEGPAVLVRNGKIFVTYSASATDHNYAMGMVWADAEADIMNKNAWHKSATPVFATNEQFKRYGPGHNSFTVSEDGKTDLLIYHARDYRELKGDPLSDPNRHTRVRKITWDAKGFPNFGQAQND